MLISHSQKFLFVHIQKTGGSTIKTLLRTRVEDLEQIGASDSPLRLGSASERRETLYFTVSPKIAL